MKWTLAFAVAAFITTSVALHDTDTGSELSSSDLAAIARVVRRASKKLLNAPHYTHADEINISGAEGVFDVSGDLKHLWPESPEAIGIVFRLYQSTGTDPLGECAYAEESCTIESQVRKDEKLYLIVHGFKSKALARWVLDIKDEILAVEVASVITVDWSKGASGLDYAAAAGNTRMVARVTAMLIRDMWKKGIVDLDKVHYIGHSLGGQTGGFFGKHIINFTGQQVGRITGLDPAGPLFEEYGVYLNKEHARFVDIIHTSAGRSVHKGNLGITISSGHADFFPSGGIRQPGCELHSSTCSHSRATLYYANSVRRCNYDAKECYNWYAFLKGMCKSCERVPCGTMGHWASPNVTGDLFLFITAREPHCAGRGSSILPSVAMLVTWLVLLVL